MVHLPLIQLEEVSVLYPQSQKFVLHNLSLEIQKGEFCVITGENGSGKSTLLKLLYGGIKPYSGRCRVGDYFLHNLGRGEMGSLRRMVGIIFQDFRFIPRSVFENLALPLEIRGLSAREILRKVEKTLGRIGIPDLIDASISELSMGQKQKVAIARAVIHDPVLIVADEPTKNLDSDTSIEIVSLMNDLNTEGKTFVVASPGSGLFKRFQNVEFSLSQRG